MVYHAAPCTGPSGGGAGTSRQRPTSCADTSRSRKVISIMELRNQNAGFRRENVCPRARSWRVHVCTSASALLLFAAAAASPSGIAHTQTANASTIDSTTSPRNGSFTLEQIRSYSYPEELTSAPTGSRIAWVFNRRGVRNIWAAEGPDFKPRAITDYRADDGQELTNLSISPDGRTVVYVRGGDHDANWVAEGGLQPDPAHSPVQPKVQILSVPFAGGTSIQAPKPLPKLLADGDEPVISPRGDRLAFTRDHAIWVAAVNGSSPAKRLFFARGESGSPVWSPSGDRLAFVSNRGDHSFIGVFTSDSAPILYLAPSTSNDMSPRWSPDGTRIAFVRQPGTGGAPETLL